MQVIQPPKNSGLAAILSFLLPGLGQMYNGEVGKGVMIIIVQVVNIALMAIVIGFITGPIVMIWAIYDAYKTAERINQQYMQQFANAGYQPAAPAPMTYPRLGQTAAMPVTPSSQPLGGIPDGMKKCPKCAEAVQAEAQICRYCGHEFVAAER